MLNSHIKNKKIPECLQHSQQQSIHTGEHTAVKVLKAFHFKLGLSRNSYNDCRSPKKLKLCIQRLDKAIYPV